MNNTHFLKEYLPVRYDANATQLADREACYAFKDGYLNEEVKNAFLDKLNTITQGDKANWSICFIPASTQNKTNTRYAKLAKAIEAEGYNVAMNTIPDFVPYFANYDEMDDYDPADSYEEDYDDYDCYEEEDTYDCYNGSYAQDIEGWSDQDIDDVFDGDPDAYWNID